MIYSKFCSASIIYYTIPDVVVLDDMSIDWGDTALATSELKRLRSDLFFFNGVFEGEMEFKPTFGSCLTGMEV